MKINYETSIVNLTNALMQHYGLPTKHKTLPEVDRILAKDYDHVVLFCLDGYGKNLFTLHAEESAFLKRHHVRDITSVYPSTTTAATTALLTGLTPYESGYFGWFQYFEDLDIHYTVFLQEDYYDKQKAIPKGFHKQYFERKDVFEQIKEKGTAATRLIFPQRVDKNGGYTSFPEGLKMMRQFQKQNKRTLSYFYAIEPDMQQHLHGTKAKEVKDMVRFLNAQLAEAKAAMGENTLFIVTADHGLTDVEPINLFDYHDVTCTFRALPANEPRMTNFFIKTDMREYFIRFFEEHFGDFFNLYTKEEFLMKKMLGHGEKHPLIDVCMGDFIAVAKDRYFFKLSDDKEHKAHHAGVTDDEMVVPLMFITKDDA